MAQSWWEGYRQRARAVREGDLLVREAKRSLKRFSHRLSPEAQSQVRGAVEAFAAAKRAARDEAGRTALVDAVNALDKMLDTHLSFARKSTGREYAEAIVTAVVIAVFLRTFVVEAFKIPSGSMIPTLQVGDHIFVNKFIYGIGFPFTDYKIATGIRKPQRGEVIVFKYPNDREKDFIKRIVAVEGDTVEMRDDVLYVNKQPVDHAPIGGPCLYQDFVEETEEWEERRCEAVRETVPHDRSYTTIYSRIPALPGPPHTTPPFRVPEHSVYVMGDNRDNSHDSRFWGQVPEQLIKGKAMVIWWSQGDPDRESGPGSLDWMRSVPILRYIWGARYGRMFKLVK
jgi:signal peptidase I